MSRISIAVLNLNLIVISKFIIVSWKFRSDSLTSRNSSQMKFESRKQVQICSALTKFRFNRISFLGTSDYIREFARPSSHPSIHPSVRSSYRNALVKKCKSAFSAPAPPRLRHCIPALHKTNFCFAFALYTRSSDYK